MNVPLPPKKYNSLGLILLIPLLLGLSCRELRAGPSKEVELEISLFTGLQGVARVGETYLEVTKTARFPFKKLDLTGDAAIQKLKFSNGLEFASIGVKVYFKRSGVVLITAQEPFKGGIKNKKIRLFTFSVPPVSDWAELLIRELGMPESRASGGRFGSEALFYSWGDISYNRMGPNQLALYRDPEIAKYRLNNFGREVQLFPDKK